MGRKDENLSLHEDVVGDGEKLKEKIKKQRDRQHRKQNYKSQKVGIKN